MTGAVPIIPTMLRHLAEQATHRLVFRRRLPDEFGALTMFTSTEGGLRYLARSSRAFDPVLYDEVRTYVRPGDVVWDIGANVGLFTLTAASRSGPAGRVLAIEPDPWLAGLVRRSARANARAARPIAPVEVLPVAISDETGVAELCLAKRNRSTNYLAGYGTTQTGGERGRILVPTFTIDGLLDHFPAPNVLKIDVEGAEVPALRGAAKVLQQRPVVICEVALANATAVDEILAPLGYRYLDAEGGTGSSDRPIADNAIALPPGFE